MANLPPYGGARPPFRPRPGQQRPGNHNQKYVRRNERIRAPEVRLIAPDGRQVGIVPTRDALHMAQNAGLDLIEVSSGVNPPVCRIVDYGKYMYDLGKKSKDRIKSHTSKLKEIKLRPRIEAHDYETKMRRMESFLAHGNKVKITLSFRGREMEYRELGFGTVNRAVNDISHIATPDSPARLMGRNITLTLSPLPANRRKLKYTQPDEEIEEDEDDEGDAGESTASEPPRA